MDPKKLEGLGPLIDEVDGSSPEALAQQQQQQQQQAQQLTDAQAWAAVPMMVGKLACMIAPELAPIYSEENCKEWGASVVPVAEKYGWGGPGALPELSLAISTAGFAVPTFIVVRARLAELRKASEAKAKPDGAADETQPGAPAIVAGSTGAEGS